MYVIPSHDCMYVVSRDYNAQVWCDINKWRYYCGRLLENFTSVCMSVCVSTYVCTYVCM